jgi:sporulation protein YlmC with PRC-barrel domain
MQRIYSHIIGHQVCRIQDGEVLGLVIDFIINPEQGKIEGFWVRTVGLFGRKMILPAKDIVEWKVKLYVHDENSFCEPADLVRLADILENEITVYNKKVITTTGIYIGRVYDFNFELESCHLLNFFIVKKLLFFTLQRRIVPLKEVVEINQEAIIIKSDLKLAKWKKKSIIDLKNFVFTPDPEPKMG